MALQCYNPGHPDAVSGWVALTAAAPYPAGACVIHIRDTAASISGGAVTTAAITLPRRAYQVLYGIAGANGTLTAGTGTIRWVAKGATYVTNSEPTPTDDDTSGMDFAPTIVADTNEYGTMVGGVPESFKIRFTGVTGTATTLDVRVEVHLA